MSYILCRREIERKERLCRCLRWICIITCGKERSPKSGCGNRIAGRIFPDPELKKQYYSIEARSIICRLEEKRAGFRSQFRKSFTDTLIRQHDWMSRKQKDIALDILGIGVADTALVEAREEQNASWSLSLLIARTLRLLGESRKVRVAQ